MDLQVFTNWINLHLSKRGLEIKDLQKDFQDGERLCALIEELSGKKIPDILSVIVYPGIVIKQHPLSIIHCGTI